MNKYIDADKLIAEIERSLYFDNNWIEGDERRQARTNGVSSAYYKRIGSKHACESILDFITSLRQEQPEVDLEKEIEEWWQNWVSPPRNEYAVFDKEEFINIVRHFYELGLKARKEE